MAGMKQAVDMVNTAISTEQKIVVVGDYDADGITSSVLMYHALSKFNANYEILIPNREIGYGLSNSIMKQVYELEPNLVITVDCGISNINEISELQNMGIDVIVIDHHEPKEVLPNCIVVNPKQDDDKYPFKHFSGVGLVWKFISQLNTVINDVNLREDELLDLVAIGTVADMVPLEYENRYLVSHGLAQMNRANRTGVAELIKRGYGSDIDETTIGFTIAPLINAAGRVGNPKIAYELLILNGGENDKKRAKEIVNELYELNVSRKKQQAKIVESLELPDFSDRFSFVHWDQDYVGGIAVRS
jgi:single-stranded-DNA-specific exonuclease